VIFGRTMADPVENPTRWPKEHHAYLEKHGVYDILQEMMKELIIWKPEDPLEYMADEIEHIVQSIHAPRVFLIGPIPEAEVIGQKIAEASGSKFLTLDQIINEADAYTQEQVEVFLGGNDIEDESTRKGLIETIGSRLDEFDCIDGYVLCGFPQSRQLAQLAQQNGLLPRQVFVLLPEDTRHKSARNKKEKEAPPPQQEDPQMATADMQKYKNYKLMRDVAGAYNLEICKAINYERWSKMDSSELESELMGVLITRKPTGAPWIPRIIVLGPPACGKSAVADYIAAKYQIVNADWIDMVRGAALWTDEVAQEAQQYLIDLKPLSESAVEKIIERKLGRQDCQKKGWILQGFPETVRHCRILERLSYCPNRIFIMSCPEEVCAHRTIKKQKAIMKRQLSAGLTGVTPSATIKTTSQLSSEHNIVDFPYSEQAVNARLERYSSKVEEINEFYDFPIEVDASNTLDNVRHFVEAALLRPPTNTFSNVF